MVKMTSLALTACLAGSAPGLALAEVCLRGSSVPMTGLKPFLHGCDILFRFEDSFGVGGVLVNDLPMIAASSKGRPQVGVWFEFDDLVDVLDVGSQGIGKSLEGATSEFEGALKKVVCGGAYDAFLKAGGSLRVTLSALRRKTETDPLEWPTERFALIDFEIGSPQDCEAT